MERMIFTAKGKAPVWYIPMSIVCFILGILCFCFYIEDSEDFSMLFLSIICIIVPIFDLVIVSRANRCYLNIYDYHIEGMGMHKTANGSVQNFNFPNTIVTANRMNGTICITDGSSKYYLYFPKQDIEQIISIINNTKHTGSVYRGTATVNPSYAPPQYDATRTFYCANCSTACVVPVGKGYIRITCPRCGYQFEANT